MTKILQSDRDAATAIVSAVRGYGVKLPNDGHQAIQTVATHREQSTRKLVEALGWIKAHCDKLRNGTDDWFELVEISAAAQSAINKATQ